MEWVETNERKKKGENKGPHAHTGKNENKAKVK